MPKKLTMFGVLMALAIGAITLFQGTASAARPPIQGFPNSGALQYDYQVCFDGAAPTLAQFNTIGNRCGTGSSPFHVANDAAPHTEWLVISDVQGNRQSLPESFIPSAPGEWGTAATACTQDANNDCTENGGLGITVGNVTAQVDILCSGGAFDVLADAAGGTGAWPAAYLPFNFGLVAQGTAPGPASPNDYINKISPFPSYAVMPFVSLSKSLLNNLFVAGTIPNPIATTPLQLLRVKETAASGYVTGDIDVSVALLAGSPLTAPQNDYLCLDTPQNSLTQITTEIPPTVDGLYPRWTILTSAKDVVNGEAARIIDLQCVGVGAVTAGPGGTDVGVTDADDDCLPTPADTNDANPDQDGDSVPDGIEARMGTSITNANTDSPLDTANDATELFDFTNARTSGDSDGDGSLDAPDTLADEEQTSNLYVSDTIADDNCPADANPDQLNTDALNEYHGGSIGLETALGGTITATSVAAANETFTVSGSALNPPVNSFVNIAGVSGGGGSTTSAQAQLWRTAINGNHKVATTASGGGTFTFVVTGGAAAPGPVTLTTTALGTTVTRPVTGDLGDFGQYGATNPDSDPFGDACDTDIDNDGLGNVNETLDASGAPQPLTGIKIAAWSGPGANCDPAGGCGALFRGTSCLPVSYSGAATVLGTPGSTAGGNSTALSARSGDSDGDLVLDGIECLQGSRPDMSNKLAAFAANDGSADCTASNNIPYGSIDPDGCATPKLARTNTPDTNAEDRDNITPGAGGKDDLYFSGCNICAAQHDLIEQFYRVINIVLTNGAEANDTDCDTFIGTSDADSDADWNITMTIGGTGGVSSYVGGTANGANGCVGSAGSNAQAILKDGTEVRHDGTDPSNPDSDDDGCDDAREVGDVNGDRTVQAGDVALLSVGTTNYKLANGSADVNKAAQATEPKQGIENRDVNKDLNLTSGDKTLIATIQGKGSACTSNRLLGITVPVTFKNP